MTDLDFESRIVSIVHNETETEKKVESLVEDLGVAIADRLTSLFKNRDAEGQKKWSEFDPWLRAQFEYDHFSVYDVFRVDEELKKLLGYVDNGTNRRRHAVAEVVNRQLKAAGYKRGLNSRMTDTEKF